MMPTEWHLLNHATTIGSPTYYVVRFSLPEQRQHLRCWFAWFEHIDEIIHKAKDPGVARLKIDWWREEVQRIKQQARHPLAQALSPQVQHDWQTHYMQAILDDAEQRICQRTPMDEAAFYLACEQHGGSRAILLSNTSNDKLQTQAKQLGCYCSTVQKIQTLARDTQQGYFSLPKTLRNQPSTELTKLLTTQEASIRQSWPQLRRQPVLHVALRMTAQALALSRLMQRRDFNDHQYVFQLSPIRNLWHAWRMH